MIAIKALFVGLAAVSVCMAISISGTVTDTGGIPIEGARVYLEQNKDSATSDSYGHFTISVVTGVKNQISQIAQKSLASIQNGFLLVNLEKNSEVAIFTYNLQGKLLATIQKTMNAGNQSIDLPQMGAGVYLYKVKMGKNEILLKSNTAGGVSQGSIVNEKSATGHNGLAKQAKVMATINDVIASTKAGYLDYRCVMQYNSDITGVVIRMIVCAGTVKDTDGNVYQTVKIGNQVWTVENLRVTKYKDGSAITKITDNAAWVACSSSHAPAYCYYLNMTNADSIKKWGALYNWYTVNTGKLAPTGWHVPTDSEWEVMQSYLVMHGYNYDSTTDTAHNRIAMALAAKTDWIRSVDPHNHSMPGYPGDNLTKNNSSGFSALPGGDRSIDGYFDNYIGQTGYWWSATEGIANGAYDHFLFYLFDYLASSNGTYKNCGFSVRLVRNN